MTSAVRDVVLMGQGRWRSFPFFDAALDLDFQNGRYYQEGQGASIASLITTSRASSGYADDAAGLWSNFLSNVARITNKGLLVEEARTNSLPNNSMQGVVAGSPGTLPTGWTTSAGPAGLTRTILGVGVENGIDYIDIKYAGTASSTAVIDIRPVAAISPIVASSGQTWSSCFFFSALAGTGLPAAVVGAYLSGLTAAGTQVEAVLPYFACIIGAPMARASATITLANASSVRITEFLRISSIVSGTVCDFTIRIGWPQLELGAFATSPIRTTSAAATRAADVVTVTTTPAPGAAYSLFSDAVPHAPITSGTNQFSFYYSNGNTTNRIALYRIANNGNGAGIITAGGTTLLNAGFAVWDQFASKKIAIAYKASDQVAVFDGGVLGTSFSALAPTGITTAYLGSQNGINSFWNGYIERAALWLNTRLPNSDLQRITV